MARLWQSGFELNSAAAGVEFSIASGTTISSSTVRSGAFAGRVSSLVSATNQRFTYAFKASSTNGPFYFRYYINIATLPSAENRVFALSNSSTTGTGVWTYITLDNTGALRLYDNVGVIGSPSSALSTNTWYMVEVLFDRTAGSGSQVVRARIDGTEFAAATNRTLTNGLTSAYFGGNLASEAQTTGDWFFDDLAINDNTGSFQTSYPGSGKIIHLKPNAAGDANSFAVQIGGTAGSTNNFTRVNEIPPDDATTYNSTAVLNQEDLFNVDDSGIGASDTVNVVSVGGRFADLVAVDATSGIKFEIMKTSGGTKAQSANIVPNTTTWSTNAVAAPHNYPITLYQDPDSSNWTQTTLDSMQIGYILDAAAVRAIAISNVWALVDYTPAGATTSSTSTSQSTSTSISTSSTSTSQSTSTSSTSQSTSTSLTTSTSSTSTSLSTSSTSTSISISTSSTSTSTTTLAPTCTSDTAPTAATNDAAIGDNDWTNPTNAEAADGVYATVTEGNIDSHYLKVSGFGFSIPAGSTIKGVTVKITRHGSTGGASSGADGSLLLAKAGVLGGTDKADTVTAWTGTDTTITYGGSFDLWGNTLAPSDVNNTGFGVGLAVLDSAIQFSAFVDQITMKVCYYPPAFTTSTSSTSSSTSTSISTSSTSTSISTSSTSTSISTSSTSTSSTSISTSSTSTSISTSSTSTSSTSTSHSTSTSSTSTSQSTSTSHSTSTSSTSTSTTVSTTTSTSSTSTSSTSTSHSTSTTLPPDFKTKPRIHQIGELVGVHPFREEITVTVEVDKPAIKP